VLIANDATDDNTINADSVIRPIEQQFQNIIGSEVHNKFNVLEQTNNKITLDIQGLPKLCTLITNLFLPTCTEIQLIYAWEQDKLQQILFERRIVEISEQKLPEQFSSGSKCGIYESKTVQFKCLKTEKKGKTDFADRVIKNKFTSTISSFANASGGNIFYGIEDDGTVAGVPLSKPEKEEITKKLEAAVRKMIWPEEIERGKQWDIKFVPCGSESMFVIVISVSPCIGGVFTKEPESYYVENGEVKKMSFDSWKKNMYRKRNTYETCMKVAKPAPVPERGIWSSKKSRNEYMKATERLEHFRQHGKWKMIEDYFNDSNERNDLPVNDKLVSLFQIVAVKYRQGNFEDAEKYLMEFKTTKNSAEDKSIFDVEELYSASAIERSRGDYTEAWSIIKDGLALAEIAPAGFVPASFYAHAASVLSYLVNDESFIGESKDKKDLEDKIHEHTRIAEDLCYKAFQHLKYIENDFEIAKEELKQRISITSALLCLSPVGTDHAPISSSDIKAVVSKISESDQFFQELKQTAKTPARLTYNHCRLLMAKSDLSFRKYQIMPTDIGIELVEESLEYVQQARTLAAKNNFSEIMMFCAPREEHLKQLNR
jgi:tetratricopeptide (TPR) repeat protein